jgi:hypothetical protein
MAGLLKRLYRLGLTISLVVLVVSTVQMLFPSGTDSSPTSDSLETAAQRVAEAFIVDGYCPASPEVDLGDVTQGASALSTFCVNNDGVVPVQIIGLKKSCHCLDVNVKLGTVVPPGKCLKFIFAMPTFAPGRHSSTVTVETNSSFEHLQSLRFTLTATVQPKSSPSLSKSSASLCNDSLQGQCVLLRHRNRLLM